jgi:hypothetical protein
MPNVSTRNEHATTSEYMPLEAFECVSYHYAYSILRYVVTVVFRSRVASVGTLPKVPHAGDEGIGKSCLSMAQTSDVAKYVYLR